MSLTNQKTGRTAKEERSLQPDKPSILEEKIDELENSNLCTDCPKETATL